MTQKQVQALSHGMYTIYWKEGGASLAAVGSLANGTRWMAPTNWVNWQMESNAMKSCWRKVRTVEKLNYDR